MFDLSHSVSESWDWYIIEHPARPVVDSPGCWCCCHQTHHFIWTNPKLEISIFAAEPPDRWRCWGRLPAGIETDPSFRIGRNFIFCCRVTKLQLMVHTHTTLALVILSSIKHWIWSLNIYLCPINNCPSDLIKIYSKSAQYLHWKHLKFSF